MRGLRVLFPSVVYLDQAERKFIRKREEKGFENFEIQDENKSLKC